MIKQEELQKMAERCGFNGKFRWNECCPLCYYYGEEALFGCCAFCTLYPHCVIGQGTAEDICKRKYDEETAKRKEVPQTA